METVDSLGGVDRVGSGLTMEQLEQQRMLAMRAWEMQPLRRTQPHPMYRTRRADDSKSLLWHGMVALAAFGALMLVSTF